MVAVVCRSSSRRVWAGTSIQSVAMLWVRTSTAVCSPVVTMNASLLSVPLVPRLSRVHHPCCAHLIDIAQMSVLQKH